MWPSTLNSKALDMKTPPRLWLRFFRWFCHPDIAKYVEGDLTELYSERLDEKGKRYADARFFLDVILLLRPSIIKPLHGLQRLPHKASCSKVTLPPDGEISWRNKGYSLINVGGLAVGMTVALLVGLWVYDEISYDHNFDHYSKIARVAQNQEFDGQIETWMSQAMQLGPELRTNYANNFDHVVIGTFAGVTRCHGIHTAHQFPGASWNPALPKCCRSG